MSEFRIIQDGMVVSGVYSTDRETALREIMHYAAVYSEDGPLHIEEKVKKGWRKVEVEYEIQES